MLAKRSKGLYAERGGPLDPVPSSIQIFFPAFQNVPVLLPFDTFFFLCLSLRTYICTSKLKTFLDYCTAKK